MARNDDDFLFTYFTRCFIGLVFPSRFSHFIYSSVYMRKYFICWLDSFGLEKLLRRDKLSIGGARFPKHFTEDKAPFGSI